MTDALDGRRAFNSRGQSETASITTVTHGGSAEVAPDRMCLCACMKPARLLEYVDSFISGCHPPTGDGGTYAGDPHYGENLGPLFS